MARLITRPDDQAPGEGVPLGEGVEQSVDERECRHGRPVDEPGVQRVVAGAQRAVDDRAAVVADGEGSALHPADQLVRCHAQPRLLPHLADERGGVVLARLHAAARHRPQPAPRLVGALHEQ